jgi:hypothetical protein
VCHCIRYSVHLQVYHFLPQLYNQTLSAGWRLASHDSAEIDMVSLRRYWGMRTYVPGTAYSAMCQHALFHVDLSGALSLLLSANH